ncbi:hypothetical protein [Janibacter cremeus]|uniref:Uncharacterized protein n=1 Tax=Janibacter cremeus TaxID=1285192 RepID=A0A852VY59_9MICO|nr:hypothetical protein [Janibacter cremeus]NYF98685.1 hypothetical protein [Janibacter cremeus]
MTCPQPRVRPFASEVTMVRLLIPLLLMSAAGGREPAEHTVWDDEDEAREAAFDAAEAAEAAEDDDTGSAPPQE